ncbi:tetratricopeptide repeat protein [candidate division WOR-3 bacterium]|nr:tetratricopeptide repeat protein [candidate division WOR-3 bacterium]
MPTSSKCADGLYFRYLYLVLFLPLGLVARPNTDSLLAIADSLDEVGFRHFASGSYSDAIEAFEEEVKLRVALGGEDTLVAELYTIIGGCNSMLARYEESLSNCQRALEIYVEQMGPQHPFVAGTYNNIGIILNELGSYHKALEYYEKALAIQLDILEPSDPDVGLTYNNIGTVCYNLGDYDKALEYFNKDLEITLAAYGPDDPDVAVNYNNIGMVYDDLGLYKQALECFGKDLEINLAYYGPEHPEVASSYSNLGTVYDNLGSYELALENHEKALGIRLKAFGTNHPDVSSSYNNIGVIYHKLGSRQKALSFYEKALDIRLKILGPEHPEVAANYNNIGVIYDDEGSYSAALEKYMISLETRLAALGPDHPDVATSYNNIGAVYHNQGLYTEALENYFISLGVRLKVLGQNHPDVAASYDNIARTYRSMDDLDSALEYFKKSVDIFEGTRKTIGSAKLEKSYTETVSDRYEALISLLLEMGKPEEAFEYLERSKLKILKGTLEERLNMEIGHGELRKRVSESRKLAMQIQSLEEQLLGERLKPDSQRSETRITNLSFLLDGFYSDYAKVVAEIEAYPDYSFAVKVEPVHLEEILERVPDKQKILMLYSGERELYLFLLSSEGSQGKSVKITRDSLDSLINICRRLCFDNVVSLNRSRKLLNWSWVKDTTGFYTEEVVPLKDILALLYSYLISPVEDELSDADVVTIVPSGNLYYLPWGGLLKIDKKEMVFLSERFNWHVMTSAEFLRCIQRRGFNTEPIHSLTLVGNPAGANLPSAEEEVVSISEAYPGSVLLTAEEGSEAKVAEAASYTRALHLATHCVLDADSPWDSYIYLADSENSDGMWTAYEVSAQSWDSLELVTLSACESALGGAYPGMEQESMAKAFSLAMKGSPSIVATLWPVYDPSTKEFMVTFYEELKYNPKSEALRKAQQKLIHSEEYAHPFFWAPFILIGEWR